MCRIRTVTVFAWAAIPQARSIRKAGAFPGDTAGVATERPVGFPARNCLPWHAMARETLVDSRQEILRTAARLFQQRGYDATSMNDVAAALKLSKGGLYHHFQSKDEILFEIMNHAMEITQERVLNPVRGITDPEDRLRALIRLHIEVVLSPRDREITVMLHEKEGLHSLRRKRDGRRAAGSPGERRGQPARGGIRSARNDQLDLPVVQAG